MLVSLKPISEKAFQSQVVKLSRMLGWMCFHVYDSRRSHPGFPDLVLVRERIIFAELKTDTGKVTPEQQVWLDALKRADMEAYVWRPRDLQRIAEILG